MRRHIENRRKTGNGSHFSSRTEKQRGEVGPWRREEAELSERRHVEPAQPGG